MVNPESRRRYLLLAAAMLAILVLFLVAWNVGEAMVKGRNTAGRYVQFGAGLVSLAVLFLGVFPAAGRVKRRQRSLELMAGDTPPSSNTSPVADHSSSTDRVFKRRLDWASAVACALFMACEILAKAGRRHAATTLQLGIFVVFFALILFLCPGYFGTYQGAPKDAGMRWQTWVLVGIGIVGIAIAIPLFMR